MKTILIPTDFSANAMHAACYAASLAKVLDAKIVFLNSYSLPMMFEYDVAANMNTSFADMQKITELNLEDFTKEFIRKTNFSPDRISEVADYGIVTDSIIEKSKGQSIDLVVMATKGAHNFLDRWLGTNAEKVAKLAGCPVWIIPEEAKLEYPAKILYAADFKENEGKAAKKLLDIASPLGATCKFVHVHEYYEPKIGTEMEDTLSDLEAYFKNENISFKEINRPDVVKGLEKYIKGYKPDVVAFAIHEKSFLEKLFSSSVSSHFLVTANLPILTFHN